VEDTDLDKMFRAIRRFAKSLLEVIPDRPKYEPETYCARCYRDTCWYVDDVLQCAVCGKGFCGSQVEVLAYRLKLAERACIQIYRHRMVLIKHVGGASDYAKMHLEDWHKAIETPDRVPAELAYTPAWAETLDLTP
jgi:hypothetical protein